MKKITIGFITNTRGPAIEDKKFARIAKQVGVDLVVINSTKDFDIEEIKKRAANCDIIYNDEADYVSLELAKSLELFGHNVVELSESFYYTEDKWLMYLKFLKYKIPTPETILLSSNLTSAREELVKFGKFPVILKRISGFQGNFVEKADNADEAIDIIKKFWEKGEDRYPILAQEFVHSHSYRVTTIGGEVVQTALKKSKDWKETGVFAHRIWKFKIDEGMEKILKKIKKMADIDICGIDFAKKGNKWMVIEINAAPAYDFFASEYNMLVKKVLLYLKSLVKKMKKKRKK
jgi:glutathione synthase/RimK-type ligase-like ATP-grasp enzyme